MVCMLGVRVAKAHVKTSHQRLRIDGDAVHRNADDPVCRCGGGRPGLGWSVGSYGQVKGEAMEQCSGGGTVARWRGGAVARWRGGAVARWRGGAVAQWRGGAVAQWRSGAVGSEDGQLTRRSSALSGSQSRVRGTLAPVAQWMTNRSRHTHWSSSHNRCHHSRCRRPHNYRNRHNHHRIRTSSCHMTSTTTSTTSSHNHSHSRCLWRRRWYRSSCSDGLMHRW